MMNTFPMYPGSMKPMSPPTAMTPGGRTALLSLFTFKSAPFVPFVPPMKAMTNSLPMPSQGTLVAPSAPAQPTKDQIISVFVSKIAPGVEDEFIRKLLDVIFFYKLTTTVLWQSHPMEAYVGPKNRKVKGIWLL
jgi:hypothetical protein